jgi:non-ribosomal peptide synthetase component E (peptide arylation enzyme)
MTLSLAGVLAESARRLGDRTAVIDGGRRVSYRGPSLKVLKREIRRMLSEGGGT